MIDNDVVSNLITSATSAINSSCSNSNVTSANTATNTLYGYNNATSAVWQPYTSSTTAPNSYIYSYPNSYHSSYVEKILEQMPILLKIKKFTIINKNDIEINFERYSHKNCSISKFLPLNGTLYFGNDLYGVYTGKDYFYWENSIIVKFENSTEAASKLQKKLVFTTVNNWDERITNEEVFEFLKDCKKYKRYAHIELEKLLEESDVAGGLSNRLVHHNFLDQYLLNE